MDYIIHRVNNLEKLSKLSKDYGAEIDVLYDNERLVLKHSPYDKPEKVTTLEDFLKVYDKQKLIINVKTSGIEENIIELTKKYTENFLLLDVEFPYIVNNYKKYGQYLMLRISKFENINNLDQLNKYIEWVWLDTYEKFEFKDTYKDELNAFKICLVSIERWLEDYETVNFINEIKDLNLNINAVLTDTKTVKKWEKFYISK